MFKPGLLIAFSRAIVRIPPNMFPVFSDHYDSYQQWDWPQNEGEKQLILLEFIHEIWQLWASLWSATTERIRKFTEDATAYIFSNSELDRILF